MLEWKEVLGQVGSTLGSSAGDCILEFLKILPEEVTEGRKISLTVRTAVYRVKEHIIGMCQCMHRVSDPVCRKRSS